MAFQRYSNSFWYAYSTLGTSRGDDALLTISCNGGVTHARAGDLKLLGPAGNVLSLQSWLRGRPELEGRVPPLNADWVELRQAVDAFLRSVYEAGTPMPSDVARRVRVYRRLIDRALRRDFQGVRRSETEMTKWKDRLLVWWDFNKRALRKYPPPQLSREILELESARALRCLSGQEVSVEQDQEERARIQAAREWPKPVRELNSDWTTGNPALSSPSAPEQQSLSSEGHEETYRVTATVCALIPEFHQVKVRDAEGRLYALTRRTRGIDLGSLHEGQQVECVVTLQLPRVLSATAM